MAQSRCLIAQRGRCYFDTQARLLLVHLPNKGWEVIPEQVTGKGGINALIALKDMPNDGSATRDGGD